MFLQLQKLRLLFILLFFLGITSIVYAQRTIEGAVLSADNNEQLIGVNVILKNGDGGTVTDLDGKYKIEVPNDEAILVFSYIGYLSMEVTVGSQNNIDVYLETDAQQIDEVVVTAFGIKRQKRELGYSTEKIDGKDLELSNAQNAINALSGKAAGVNIISPNGVDGGTTRIEIRGNNNLTGQNQPLIIVDGVPMENNPGWTDVGRGQDWGSAINNINTFDIENINILKGPTASALYGSRGANGVVLITTKRGKSQKGIGVNYTFSYKIIQPYRYRDVQNKYGSGGPNTFTEPTFPLDVDGTPMMPDGQQITDGPNNRPTSQDFGYYSTGVSWGPKMEGQMVRWWDGEMRPYSPQPDNLGLYFSDGSTMTNNLSFSGGNDFGNIRASLTHSDHQAVIPNSNYKQTTINLGSNINISSKVKADISASYIDYHRLNSPSLGDDNESSFGKGILYSWPRSYKGLEKEINILPDGTKFDYDGRYPFTFAPEDLWWNTYNNNTTLDRNKLIGALALSYDITDWLTAMGRVGIDLTVNQFEKKNNPINSLGIEGGAYTNNLSRNLVTNAEFLLTAHKETIFNSKFNTKLSFGGNQWKRRIYAVSAKSENWNDPWLFTYNNSGNLLSPNIEREIERFGLRYEDRNDKDINSLYGFLNISYDDFLFLDLTGRNDWTSSLPVDNNSYFYPSASLSFILSEAADLKLDWLNFLKIRASVAKTATDANPYLLDFVYSTGTFGGVQTASLPTTIPPIALKPQTASSYEVGTTLGFLDDKISFDFTYYYIRSFDQILDSPLPASSGANTITINSGELENKGIEIILNAQIINRKHFYFHSGLNFARNRNYVTSLGDGAKLLEIANIWGLNGPAIAVREGEEFGTIIGYDYIYDEASGKPILNEEGTHYLITENRVPIGNASPDFTGGWTTTFGFKEFKLSTLVDCSWGGDLYAGSYVVGLQTGQSPETLLERDGGGLPYTDPDGNVRNVGIILDGVYENGAANDKVVHYYYKYLPNAGGWGKYPTKPGILENNWVKFREIALSYQFSSDLMEKSKIFQNLTISLVGRDLFYIYTSIPDKVNPEGANGAGNARGLEWASYPGMRSFSIMVNASF